MRTRRSYVFEAVLSFDVKDRFLLSLVFFPFALLLFYFILFLFSQYVLFYEINHFVSAPLRYGLCCSPQYRGLIPAE